MKKVIIIFISFILLLAVIIGASNKKDNPASYSSEDDDLYESELPTRLSSMTNNSQTELNTTESNRTNKLTNLPLDEKLLEVPRTVKDCPEQIIRKLSFTVSYNNETKCPNWSAWHLDPDHVDGPFSRSEVPYFDENGNACGIGTVSREILQGDYFLDLECEEPRPLLSDWRDHTYGMSHGHLCPAGDNKWSKEAINQTFLLSNMCPQHPSLNQGAWNSLEQSCRKWAVTHGDLYIVCGPLFLSEATKTMGESKVWIPDAFYKVILCLSGTPQAIGFIYPNAEAQYDRSHYVTTVDEVEALSGIDFFYRLEDVIENAVESSSNLSLW